jgi:tRNA-2-methylthio-N6-dimethylallyladenosine synthase
MNKHDAEAVAALLEARGMDEVATPDEAELIVFLTCCVRENADERLYGQVASLKRLKTGKSSRSAVTETEHGIETELRSPLIAVGGCIGQRDGAALVKQLPHVDIVFGTHNIDHLPRLIDEALMARRDHDHDRNHGHNRSRNHGQNHDQHHAHGESRSASQACVEVLDSSATFSADLPTKRRHPWHAWLPITEGCNNFCSYCIVPSVRGREKSRGLDEVLAAATALVADGVAEITLLGQNVNSYGRDRYGRPRFAEVLRRVAATGVSRLGFATSHPKDLSDETIAAMAATPAVLRSLHLPVQSGSDRVLAAMNRRYTRDHYLALVGKLRAAMPDLALSSDIIVGFPGETEADFADTLDLIQRCRFDQVFTFLYSPRAGTRAAIMPDPVPREVAQERFERLVEHVQRHALENNLRLVGTTQEVLLEGPSKRDAQVLVGRTRGAKVCHLPVPSGREADDFGGECVQTRISAAHTWYLVGEWT